MTLKGKKIFISGGSGVIGNELVNKLHKLGATIFVGDIKPRPLSWPKQIIYRQGDLNYIAKEELDIFSPEYFFHLAATFERSSETFEFWEENFHHNVKLSNYIMTLLKNTKSLKKVIFASSYLIYEPSFYTFRKPASKAYRLKETDPISPRNLTGSAKLNHEIELKFLNEFKGKNFKSVSARIYRSYGKNSRDVISRWIRDLLNKKNLIVFAKEGMFDYIYAGEVAEGLIRLAQNPKAEGVINLGNDNARSIEDVLKILKKYFFKMKITERKADVFYEASQANMDYFYELTGWKPSQQLEDVIPEIIDFEKQNIKKTNKILQFNILITSISKKIPLLKAAKKATLKIDNAIKIYGADLDQECLGKYFVDKFWKMPNITSLDINSLINYCKKNNIKAIIPTRDGELTFFAKNKKKFVKHGIWVMVSDSPGIEICLDKLLFYKTLNRLGFSIVSTSENINDISSSEYVVKERFGAGAASLGLKLKRDDAIVHSHKLMSPIFQPFIKGSEVSVDLYIGRSGKVQGAISRKRNIVVNGESQITSVIDIPKLESLCLKIVKKLNLYGHIIIQAIIDNKGKLTIIECNSRFGGASTLSIAAGLDSFYWFLLEAQQQNIEEYPFIKLGKKIAQVRYPEDIIIDGSSI
jgi:carbamoyl-phosphate synthase large subunit